MQSVEDILKRGSQVEAEKAWQRSWTRKVAISLVIYTITAGFLHRIGLPEPLLNALVPTLGYILGTLLLSLLKDWWLKKHFQ